MIVLGMFLIASLITGTILFSYSTKLLSSVHAESMNKDISLVGNYLQAQISQITNTAYGLGNNPTLTLAINSYIKEPSGRKYIELNSTLMDKLNEIQIANSELVSSVVFIIRDQIFYDYIRVLKKDINPQTFLKDAIEAQYSFPYILRAQEDPFFYSAAPVIPLVYRFTIGGEQAFLVVLWDTSKLAEALSHYTSNDSSLVFDEHGYCVLEHNLSDIEFEQLKFVEPSTNTYTALKIDKRTMIATVGEITKPKWTIVLLKDGESVFKQARQLQYYILLIYLIVYGIVSIILYFIYRMITKPLIQLASIMESQTPWDYTQTFDHPHNDEIGTLARAYNLMMEQIQEDEKQIAWEQKEKRIAEINALQAQINPHFLYNTLNSIAWLAIDQGAQDSASLANLLASYYRTSLSKGHEFITIKEEITHVLHYLQIQQIRYPELFDFRITVEDEILDQPVVRIILQPLVENAIYHGIKPKENKGFISIIGRMLDADTIEIRVEDDGVGLPKSTLDLINKHLHDGIFHSESGYGIYNVNARIQLTYGPEYGLVIESVEYVKTSSIVRIPIYKQDST